jgi:ABC-2 type transport system ATP-binding protein
MIKTNHLSKYFGSLRAVDDVSFEIVGGECIGLLGLNGAGKTTLLRMLTSQLAPTAGSATVDGLDVASGDLAVRRRLGFLPEVPPLYGEMRVSRFLDFAARLREVPAGEVAGRVEQAVERCQLQAVVDQRIATLSYGYKKRVGIAQAIVHQPPLVVLDEPIAGLDPAQIVEMRDLIRKLRGPHTVLLSSHILSEISQTCDRILVMHRGRIAAQGSEADLLGSLARKRRLQLRVDGDGERAAELLGGLDGVEAVEPGPQDGRGAALLLTTSTDVRAAAARKVIEAGLGLLELSEQRDDLESVFLRLTGSREVES